MYKYFCYSSIDAKILVLNKEPKFKWQNSLILTSSKIFLNNKKLNSKLKKICIIHIRSENQENLRECSDNQALQLEF